MQPYFMQPQVFFVAPYQLPLIPLQPLIQAPAATAAAIAPPPEPKTIQLPLDIHTAASLIATTIYKQQKDQDPVVQDYLISHVLPLVTHLDLCGLALNDKWLLQINTHCIALQKVFLFGSSYQGQPFSRKQVVDLEQTHLPQFMEFSGHVKRMLSGGSKLIVDKAAWAPRFQPLFDLLKILPRLHRQALAAPVAVATVTDALAALTLAPAAVAPEKLTIAQLIADYADEPTRDHGATKAIVKNLWKAQEKRFRDQPSSAHFEMTIGARDPSISPTLPPAIAFDACLENDPYITILSYLTPSKEQSTIVLGSCEPLVAAPGHAPLHHFLRAAHTLETPDHPLFRNPQYARFLEIFETQLRSIPTPQEVLAGALAPKAVPCSNAIERLFSQHLAKTLTMDAVLALSLKGLSSRMEAIWTTNRNHLAVAFPRVQRLRLPIFTRFSADFSLFLTKFTRLIAIDAKDCMHMNDAAMKRFRALKLTAFAINSPNVSLQAIQELDPSKMTHLSFVVTPSANKEQVPLMLLHFPHLQEADIKVVPNPVQAQKPKASAGAIKLPGVPVYEKYDLSAILLKPEYMAPILQKRAATQPNTTHIVLHPQQVCDESLRQCLKVFTNLTVITIGKTDYHLLPAHLAKRV